MKARASIGYKSGDWVVLACDGLFDVITTASLTYMVQQLAKHDLPPQKISAHLVNGALKTGSQDNVTVMVIKL